MKLIHLHVDPAIDEEVHVFVHLTEPTDAVYASDLPEPAAPINTDTSDADAAALESVYKRFVAYDATTPARDVAARLEDLGFVAHPPQHRESSANRAAYVRFTYAGALRTTSLYLQTNATIYDRNDDRAAMSALPAAAPAAKGRVAFYFADDSGQVRSDLVDEAVNAAKYLRDLVDGNTQ